MIKADLTRPIFGRMSIFLSSLCIVHCLATPFILVLLPTLSTFFSETLERILILLVIPLSLVGFLPRWLSHRNYASLLLYSISILLILFSQFVLHSGHSHDASAGLAHLPWAGTTVTFTGAFLLAWVVYRNNRHTHTCTHPHHRKCQAHSVESEHVHTEVGHTHAHGTGEEKKQLHEISCHN
jgi:lysylphosphatidylglycerol synthetase-like protein (DUF2156 family)